MHFPYICREICLLLFVFFLATNITFYTPLGIYWSDLWNKTSWWKFPIIFLHQSRYYYFPSSCFPYQSNCSLSHYSISECLECVIRRLLCLVCLELLASSFLKINKNLGVWKLFCGKIFGRETKIFLNRGKLIYTSGCFRFIVKKLELITQAKKQPSSSNRWHFFLFIGTFWYLVSKKLHN